MVADTKSLLIYLSSFLVSVFIAYVYQKKAKCIGKIKKIVCYTAIILLPVLIAGFRYDVGEDYFRYMVNFEKTLNISWLDAINSSAPIYYLFIKCCLIIIEPQWMFLVFSYITLLILLIALEYWKDKISLPFALLIYYVSFYSWSLNGIRQGLAITMILLACTYLIRGRYKLYFLWLFLAVFVHSTAIIALSFFFCKIFIKKSNYKFVFFQNKIPFYDCNYLIVLLLSPYLINISYLIIAKIVSTVKFFSKYQPYLGEVNTGIGILGIFFLLFWPVIFDAENIMSDSVFRISMEIAATFLVFGYMGYLGFTMYRLRLYSYLIVVVMISQFCKKKKNLIKVFYYAYYLILFFVYDYIGQTMRATDIFPYKSIFMR